MAETIEYDGVKFRRYPDAKSRTDRVYYNPGIADRKRGIKRLHEEIWMAGHGPIPVGCHIHHRDGDPLNNDVSNLECLTAAQHAARHHTGHCTEATRAHLEEIRPLAAAWHSSPEGRAWHRQHALDIAATRERVEHTCEYCGQSYDAQHKRGNRFCSNACKSACRRDSGVDNETRACNICGEHFTANKYSPIKTCSRACGGKSQSRTKTASP